MPELIPESIPELIPELALQQRLFAGAVQDTAQPAAAAVALFTADAAVVQRRLALYRGNIVAGISKTLALAYPVIEQVVGANFFSGLARAYWQETPSRSGDLHDYGACFGDFLIRFPHALELPWLPDLARLEWAVHRAASAANSKAFDPSVLALLPEEKQPDLRFAFLPGTAIVQSAYPIVQIWTMHQPDHAGAFKIDWDLQQTALVVRHGLRVQLESLDVGPAALIAALLSGQTLMSALDAAGLVDPAFDAQNALAQCVTSGWISACHVD